MASACKPQNMETAPKWEATYFLNSTEADVEDQMMITDINKTTKQDAVNKTFLDSQWTQHATWGNILSCGNHCLWIMRFSDFVFLCFIHNICQFNDVYCSTIFPHDQSHVALQTLKTSARSLSHQPTPIKAPRLAHSFHLQRHLTVLHAVPRWKSFWLSSKSLLIYFVQSSFQNLLPLEAFVLHSVIRRVGQITERLSTAGGNEIQAIISVFH